MDWQLFFRGLKAGFFGTHQVGDRTVALGFRGGLHALVPGSLKAQGENLLAIHNSFIRGAKSESEMWGRGIGHYGGKFAAMLGASWGLGLVGGWAGGAVGGLIGGPRGAMTGRRFGAFVGHVYPLYQHVGGLFHSIPGETEALPTVTRRNASKLGRGRNKRVRGKTGGSEKEVLEPNKVMGAGPYWQNPELTSPPLDGPMSSYYQEEDFSFYRPEQMGMGAYWENNG